MTRLLLDVSAANALGRATGRTASQDDLDWKWVAGQGVAGVYVEGYVGNDGPNVDFDDQVKDIVGVGLPYGVYDFVFPLVNAIGHADRDPVAQAQLHASRSGPWKPGMLPFMCDLEWPTPAQWPAWGCSKQQIIDWVCAYLPERDSLAGCKVGLYTYEDFWTELTGSGTSVPAELAERPLWVAGSRSWVQPPWTVATCWQMTGQEMHVPTLSGRPPVITDCSQFLGDDAAWAAFIGQ